MLTIWEWFPNIKARKENFSIKMLATSTALCGMLCTPIPGHAQGVVTPQSNTLPPSENNPVSNIPSTPATIPVRLNLPPIEQIESPLQQLTQAAYDHGVYFNAYYIGEFAANPIGGEQQGNAYNGHLRVDGAFDLQKLLGIPGASLHISFTDRSGENLSAKRIDTDAFVQQLFGSDETYILSKFEYLQRLFGNHVEFMTGRMDLSDTFDRSAFYCLFQSDLNCGNPNGLAKDINKAAFPTPVWGGTLRIKPTQNIYAMVGAFQVDPTQTNPETTHGFNLGTGRSTGYTNPVEVGYLWHTLGAVDYNRYDIGTVMDHSTFAAKTPFGKSFYTPGTIHARTVFYAQAQQLVWQPEADSRRGLWLVGYGMFGASGSKQEENWQLTSAAVWEGPFASRPNDYIGLMFGGQHYNKAFREALFASRQAEHGTQFPYAWQYQAELNYGIQLTPWLQLLPNIQWVIDPNGLGGTTFTKANVPTAFVVGFQFNINLAQLVGIPTGPKDMMDWINNSAALTR
jgi:porin